jgi:carbonic anhydrase/acetyltransferase-like protein (isoleucine patch superfamily)
MNNQIIPVRGFTPQVDPSVFLAPTATIIGEVFIGKESSIWFNTVVRGDVHSIHIGEKSNIQDGTVVHCTYQKARTVIGNRVNIGHACLIHGCTIQDKVLIGMGSIIMDNTVVQSNVIVGAGSIVTENMILESGYLYLGRPAKKIKLLTEEHIKLLGFLPDNYKMYSDWFKA